MVLKDEKKEKLWSREDEAKLRQQEGVVYVPPVVRRPKNIRTLIQEFELDHKLGIVARAAMFLDYLARKAAYQLCTPSLVFMATMGMAKKPKDTSEEVVRFRHRSSSIRMHLCQFYNRGLVIEKPFGLMRATVDDTDLATTQQVREVERLRSSVNSARRTNAMITVAKVNDPAVRGWLKGAVNPLLKHLEEDDRIFKLLPAKPREEDGS